ncbi:hypothetical protein BJ875DRAFT_485418 [Amylocarpus encephaloides]|uniref:SprT-like domain-containing protein n=1 Tax=Amylocarpus encephaloides TaxID=45428 RepID=A0A9P7YGD2_9HELO|nr:hypothetical protein BJ875DRAFT_485418 [Amylocarpus encephaloides]
MPYAGGILGDGSCSTSEPGCSGTTCCSPHHGHCANQTNMRDSLQQKIPIFREAYMEDDVAMALCDNAIKVAAGKISKPLRHILNTPIPKDVPKDECEGLLKLWAQAFDELFFFGLVLPTCEFRCLDECHESECKGLFDPEEWIIKVYTRHPDKSSRGADTNLENFLCTVLHEMCHAFLDIYACWCIQCAERGYKNGGRGEDGHGVVWACPMVTIETALQGKVAWNVDCDISTSVEMSREKYGWSATPQQLASWGADASFCDKLKAFGAGHKFLPFLRRLICPEVHQPLNPSAS